MKFYVVSGIGHLLIILSLFLFVKNPVSMIPRMDIKDKISINFTMAYSPNNNLPLVEKKQKIKNPVISKKQKEEKKIIEEKKVEKVEVIESLELKEEIEETELVEVVEEIMDEIKEEIIEEELIEEIEIIEEVNEDKLEKAEITEEELVYEEISNENIEIEQDNNKSNTEIFDSESFILKDNSYIAKNQDIKGISYSFIKTPEPRYPNMARRAGIKGEVVIQARFLVDEKGRIEEIIFYDNVTSYGFREEVTRALNNWRLSPVTIGDKVVKMYFYKVFRFNVK